MSFLSSFVESISDIMFEEKITLEEFANKAGISVTEVYRYKRKEFLPSTITIVKIADTFKYSIDVLLGLSTYDPNVKYRQSKPFAEVFAEILRANGTTRYKLCKNTRLAASSIDDWYHGKRIPTIDNLIELKNYFNCSIDYLFGRE